MAKKSAIYRNEKRKKLAEKYSRKRQELDAIIKSKDSSPEEVFEAVLKRHELPRNSSRTRIRNRCSLSGKPRWVFRRFGLARTAVRDLAARGELPGVTNSSW